MTKEKIEQEAIRKLKEETNVYDTEIKHVQADMIIVQTLRELGCNRLADEYEEMTKDFWYA